MCHKRRLRAAWCHQGLPSAHNCWRSQGTQGTHLLFTSEHEELSEHPESARDAGTGLGCGRCVPTTAAQIKHVPLSRSTPCPCQPVVLKISICGSTVLFCFPSSSSRLTWTLISFPSKGIIHGKQRGRSKFPFSQLCQKAWGALPPLQRNAEQQRQGRG